MLDHNPNSGTNPALSEREAINKILMGLGPDNLRQMVGFLDRMAAMAELRQWRDKAGLTPKVVG